MKLAPNFKLSSGEYSLIQFPSGELQVAISGILNSQGIRITGSILSSDHIIELLQLVEALRHRIPNIPLDLTMPYCAYSRQDRRCNPGESFSLKVFADLINSCNFYSVTTWDNHSDVSTALINNCGNIHVQHIVNTLDNESFLIENYDYLVSPDAGSNKKVFTCSKEFEIPMIRADKIRDTKTGSIIDTQVFATPEQLKDKTVIIIDDICQGGRTFEELAKAIKTIEPTCDIHLYVTHGFFNNGFNKMKEAGISKFITTNSVPQVHTCNELIYLEI